MIFAGKMTETLSFYEIVETQSATGYKHSEERFMFTCKAEKVKTKENYGVDAEELFHTLTLTFRLRFRSEIKETDVVVFREEKYRIISMDRYPRDNELVIKIAKVNE